MNLSAFTAEPVGIRHHPSDDLLLGLAGGTLPVQSRILLESHLELCATCRERLRPLMAVGGVLLDDETPVELRKDSWDLVMARIDDWEAGAQAPEPRKVAPPPPLPAAAVWPRALAECTATRWRWIAPGIRWSRITVPAAPQANMFLLRIGAGKYLPQHTHSGVEMTQVLHGRFHDGRELFGPGDFDLADGDVHHQPVVQDGSECICLAAVDGRLRFDGWLARRLGALVGM